MVARTHRDQGEVQNSVRQVEIEASGGIKLIARDGLTIEYTKTGNLDAFLDQLAKSPGLKWIQAVRNDPAVNWQGVKEQFQSWNYKDQGLTEAGATLVTLAVTAITGPLTGLNAPLTSATSSALGLTGNVADPGRRQIALKPKHNR